MAVYVTPSLMPVIPIAARAAHMSDDISVTGADGDTNRSIACITTFVGHYYHHTYLAHTNYSKYIVVTNIELSSTCSLLRTGIANKS